MDLISLIFSSILVAYLDLDTVTAYSFNTVFSSLNLLVTAFELREVHILEEMIDQDLHLDDFDDILSLIHILRCRRRV